MNSQERIAAIGEFIGSLSEAAQSLKEPTRLKELNQSDFSIEALPPLTAVTDLLYRHGSVSQSLKQASASVSDLSRKTVQLKETKKNITILLDAMTAVLELRRLSMGLGTEPTQVLRSIRTYYEVKPKAIYVNRLIVLIDAHIRDANSHYGKLFAEQLSNHNSKTLSDISKILQLIASKSQNPLPSVPQRVRELVSKSLNEQLTFINDELLKIPLTAPDAKFQGEPQYLFFELAKKVLRGGVTILTSLRSNLLTLGAFGCLQEVCIQLLSHLCEGQLKEVLLRLHKYFQIGKISAGATNSSGRLVLKEKNAKQAKLYIKEYISIWNQIERFKIYLLDEASDQREDSPNEKHSSDNKTDKDPSISRMFNMLPQPIYTATLSSALSTNTFVEFNSNIATLIEAQMRLEFDKLLKKSPFIVSMWALSPEFLKQVEQDGSFISNPDAMEYLSQMLTIFMKGIEQSMETMSTMVVSAVIQYVSQHLIYDNTFYAFNELFSKSLARLNEPRGTVGTVLLLNTVFEMSDALTSFNSISISKDISHHERFRTELQQLVLSNEERVQSFIKDTCYQIANSEWFSVTVNLVANSGLLGLKKIQETFANLQPALSEILFQKLAQKHASLILSSKFNRKYSQAETLQLESEVKQVINEYENKSLQIRAVFKKVLDYLDVLSLDSQEQFSRVSSKLSARNSFEELVRIWGLRV